MPYRPISRRGFLFATGGLAAAAALAGCGEDTPANASGSGAWEFTDDRGTKVKRDERPEKVVAYVSSAAALWDFGVHPVGVFGPQKTADGEKELQAGNIDLSKVTSLGNAWDDFDVEKFIGLGPDLLVTGLTGTKPTDLWAITPETGTKVEKTAPILALSEYKVSLPKVISRYEELARALGADVESSTVKSAKEEFQAASDELRDVAKAKAGLKVLVLYADKDGIYIAKPEFFADLSYYRELGLDIVAGGGSEDYWEQLSWEQIGKYPADLILTDTRTFALSRQQMAEYPTWTALPAVSAGQVGDWSAEPRFNYTLAAPVIRDLTKAVKGARTDIAA
ncbi:ABC transporter substrate-binding protein [Actinophytocola oryzae]|uniref:Iron complex transport system substrate-binding protein n=1 Tax=Actinophytocola oryzae TaxID=502181 RepID=A0A4R7V0Z3_9PSEU|nr:ABC transporter substrate-binding protein [Actinophytocola oryzae]TDV42234.1 iron complex transport system substrate-binding protein [Actinophytocola oryzae]